MHESAFVVIAAYNEETCIGDVVREVRAICPNVVVVDDGSTDGTYAAARRAAAWTLRHVVNRGQGAALQTGIEFALARGAGYVVTFDADGQHDPADIEGLLAPIRAGDVDITLGSRFLGTAVNLSPARKLVLKGAVLFTRIFNGVRLTDAHNGLRAFSRRAAGTIHIRADRMAHASELIDIVRRSKLPYREVPVRIRYTEYSMAKGQSHFAAARIIFHYLVGRLFP